MRMPLLAIAALAMSLSPAMAQTRALTVQEPTPNAEAAGQATPPQPAVTESAPSEPLQSAEPAPPAKPTLPAAPARYSLTRVDDGYLRLDGETGQVAFCSALGAGWACQVVPEDRAAFEQEIARLQDRVATLEKELADLREPPPPRPPADLAPAPPAAGKDSEVTIKLPTQEDIDRAGAALQNAWKRLVDMLVGFKNDMMRKG